MKTLTTHLLFILCVLGAGIFLGITFAPGEWYEGLRKPFFTPPNDWFAPIWTTLYVLIGIAGARVWMRRGPIALWVLQMALNFAWTPVFFGAQQMVAGFAIIVALLVTILVFIARAWRTDRIASVLFVPYALWVATAMALNGSLILLN